MHTIDLGHGKVLEFASGDITREMTDAIANAAKSSLMGGGGVDGAIHHAGGPEILEQCKAWVGAHGRLPTGRAMSTTAGRMPSKYVIHTVGPIWHEATHGEPELLASCYRESIRLADELKLQSIAFPSISTGAYGYPVDKAAAVAVQAAAAALRTTKYVHIVRFVLFGQHDYRVYCEAAERMAA
jgi:O-acetyl-ADP-ribose deacetylase (regulator of RNase III)